MINRWIKDRLEKCISGYPAVALLGARHVGKTTLAKVMAGDTTSIYLDLAWPEDAAMLRDPIDFLRENGEGLIIIDEIQRAPDLFAVLRSKIDSNRQQGRNAEQFLILGSASMGLLRQYSESLAGRIAYVDMTGLNVLETVAETRNIKNLWFRGGAPASYLADGDDAAMNVLEFLIRDYLERDVPQMGFTASATALRELWTMLAHLQGETINTNGLATSLQTGRGVVNRHIDILNGLFLMRRIAPWHENAGKRLVKSPRYYVRDSGILHRLLGIGSYNALLTNPVLGKSWEGFVVENIHSVLSPLAQTYFYRTAAGAQIDLVIKMPNSETWAVEIKYGVAPKLPKHYARTCDDVGATHRFVVYGGEDEFSVGENVRMISLPRIMEKIASAQS